MFNFLLAKAVSGLDVVAPVCTLPGHSLVVLESAMYITSLLEKNIKQQFLLDEEQWQFVKTVILLAAFLHDWGKANSYFQAMLYCKSGIDKILRCKIKNRYGVEQLIRHEFLSAIIVLKVLGIYQCLSAKYSEKQLCFALAAVIGHHLRAGVRKTPGFGGITELGLGLSVDLFLGHPHFQELLQIGKNYLGLEGFPTLQDVSWTRKQIEEALDELFEKLQESLSDITFSDRICLALVKAGVIAADLAGSVGVSEDWLRKVLLETLITESDLDQLIAQKLQGKPLRDFQVQLAQSEGRVTIAKAGCGLGKTVAAYLWAKRWANRRLFFTYPTTGTATQGFLDYVAEVPIEKALVHSRARIDREMLLNGEADDPALYAQEALQTWSKRLIICTADHVLGIIQNQRRSLFGWVAFTQAAFVFDEIHAYDKQLFGALLQFLKVFRGAPILLMSASLTPAQLQAIQEVCTIEKIIGGPQELEGLKRYNLLLPAPNTPIWDKVKEALNRGEKVLWVVNTVKDCVEIYNQAKQWLNSKVLIYHSRYRYKDRIEKHQNVVDAFRSSGAVFAVTTQVCEMSLDIDADLLVSDMCPAYALVQRLGRCNRYMTPGGQPKLVILYQSRNGRVLPYSQEEMRTGQELLQKLQERVGGAVDGAIIISQTDLAEALAELGTGGVSGVDGAWLDGLWKMHTQPLREGNSIVVVLEMDVAGVQAEAAQKQQKLGVSFQGLHEAATASSIPLPVVQGCRTWQRLGAFLIAPSFKVSYCSETGAIVHGTLTV